jgi:hypothetical protein
MIYLMSGFRQESRNRLPWWRPAVRASLHESIRRENPMHPPILAAPATHRHAKRSGTSCSTPGPRAPAPCAALLGAALIATAAIGENIDWDQPVPTQHIREDFAALYSGLQSAHANLYANRSAADYDRRYHQTLATFTAPMRRFDVQLAFQRFAAFGKVAHARIDFPVSAYEAFRGAGGRSFPIYPRIVDGVAYVGENYAADPRIRAGDEIVSINGEPMATWLERTAAHISADTPYIAHSLQEFTFPRDLWAAVGEVDRFDLVLGRDGEVFDVTIQATTQEAQRAAADGLPATFALDSSARSYRMLDDRLAYLQPGPFYNVENLAEPWNNAAFVAFIDQAFEHFIGEGAEALIIDLRQNPGGDAAFSDVMLAWLADRPFRFCAEFLIRSSDEAAASNAARLAADPDGAGSVSDLFARRFAGVPRGEMFAFDVPYAHPREGRRFDGRVYALVNRHSYSNAVTVAAMIQDYAFGLIVGEKTADMATTYGAMEQFRLPNTGIEVGFPKAHIVRPSGDRKPDGVTPDKEIRSPIVAGQRDVVLEALVEYITASSERTTVSQRASPRPST